jgi:hypothetical protein
MIGTDTAIDWQSLYRREREMNELLREQIRQMGEADMTAMPNGNTILRLRKAFSLSASQAKLLLIFAENDLVTRKIVSKS